MSKRRFACCSRRALTLIEVLAGIVLLSTLMVSILVSVRRHSGQTIEADMRLEAIGVLERQLVVWNELDDGFPRGRSGRFRETSEFVWTSRSERFKTSNPRWKLEKVVIEVYSQRREFPKPLARVELLVTPEATRNNPEGD